MHSKSTTASRSRPVATRKVTARFELSSAEGRKLRPRRAAIIGGVRYSALLPIR